MIVVIGSSLTNGESGFGEEKIEESVEEFLGGRPRFERHVSVGSRVIV